MKPLVQQIAEGVLGPVIKQHGPALGAELHLYVPRVLHIQLVREAGSGGMEVSGNVLIVHAQSDEGGCATLHIHEHTPKLGSAELN